MMGRIDKTVKFELLDKRTVKCLANKKKSVKKTNK